MKIYEGKAVKGGIAVGRIRFLGTDPESRASFSVPVRSVDNAAIEIARFEQARAETQRELGVLYEQAILTVGRKEAALFRAYQMLLRDEGFLRRVRTAIEDDRVNAEFAVASAGRRCAAVFDEMSDPYMRARGDDIRDLSNRIRKHLARSGAVYGRRAGTPDAGVDEALPDFLKDGQSDKERCFCMDEGIILCADELLPSELVRLPRARLAGLVLKKGSEMSHTAILAEAMELPLLIGAAVPAKEEGNLAVLDAENGRLITGADREEIESYRDRIGARKKEKQLEYGGTPGKQAKVLLMANIASAEEAVEAAENGADGIGLFRTEFLYMLKNDFPSEDEQTAAYRQVCECFPNADIVLRTFDIGGDKEISCFRMPDEQNPALGMKSIRLALARWEVLLVQLRAIIRAAVGGRIWVMFPMITSVSEIIEAKELAAKAEAQLRAEGVPVGTVRIGAMIETPAAVMIAEELAKESDFFSIGTNDLTQYTLAADRTNPAVTTWYDPGHPAVMRQIAMVIEAGHRAGIPVAVCGESAADPGLAHTYAEMGIDALSVAPRHLAQIREVLA